LYTIESLLIGKKFFNNYLFSNHYPITINISFIRIKSYGAQLTLYFLREATESLLGSKSSAISGNLPKKLVFSEKVKNF
jgi:hypothetical protein